MGQSPSFPGTDKRSLQRHAIQPVKPLLETPGEPLPRLLIVAQLVPLFTQHEFVFHVLALADELSKHFGHSHFLKRSHDTITESHNQTATNKMKDHHTHNRLFIVSPRAAPTANRRPITVFAPHPHRKHHPLLKLLQNHGSIGRHKITPWTHVARRLPSKTNTAWSSRPKRTRNAAPAGRPLYIL